MDRSSRLKNYTEIADLNNTIDNTDLTDTYMKKEKKYDQLNDAKKRHMTKIQYLFIIKKKLSENQYMSANNWKIPIE